MPTSSHQPAQVPEPEDLLIQLLPTIPKTVTTCFQTFGNYPSQEEVEEITEQIVVFLIDGGYRHLRTFEGRSKASTWMYTVIRRRVAEYLRAKREDVSLDDVPPDDLAYQADLDDEILFKERLELVLKIAETELTKHERELFELLRKGFAAREIAQEMRIEVESVHREKSALLKKLRGLIGCRDSEDGGNDD